MNYEFLSNELKNRSLPDILTFENGEKVTSAEQWDKRRLEIVDILRREEYGYAPEGPFTVTAEVVSHDEHEYANKAQSKHLCLHVESSEGKFSFPVVEYIPKSESKVPCIIHIAFRPDTPDRYMPIEEIIDNGFAVVMFCYTDIAADSYDDFKEGVAPIYPRPKYSWGKISMWAWAASRVMDYLQTLPIIDKNKIGVVGHSRLGKTSLWCGANDERFRYIFSNDSGCSGDAITRDKTGERVSPITQRFDYWFCDTYKQYAENEHKMPFDQHFLVASIAPRYAVCGAAAEDTWADPYSQFLSYVAASEVYELLGMEGFVCDDRLPVIGDTFHKGSAGYHLRSGSHFFSRYDWARYMEFMKTHD